MKKHITYLSFAFCSFASLHSSAIDLTPSNLSSNNYFESYDDNNKIIKGVHFDVLTNGTNSLNRTAAFSIKLYLYKSETDEAIFVKTINVTNGQAELSSVSYNVDVDLSGITGLTTREYRFGVFVDADKQIAETNEENNAILFTARINFTAGNIKKADLLIDSYSYSYKNGILKFDYLKVKNVGSANAAASTVAILVEDKDGNNADITFFIDPVAAGSTLTVMPDDFDLTFIPEDIKLSMTITADFDNKISESDETNNEIRIADISLTTRLASGTIREIPSGILTIGSELITLTVFESDAVELELYDMKGSIVGKIQSGTIPAGTYQYSHHLEAGQPYMCRLATSKGSFSKKIVLQ